MITVHYHRFDNDYEGIGLWTWAPEGNRPPERNELPPAGWDDYGPFFHVDPAQFFDKTVFLPIGMVPRLRHDWRFKDGDDRFWTPEMGVEVWLLGEESRIYTHRPDTSPRVQNAFLDAATKLTLKLSHSMEVSRIAASQFHIRDEDGAELKVASAKAVEAHDNRSKIIELTLAAPVEHRHHLTAQVVGFRPAAVLLRDILMDATRFSFEGEMGAVYTPTGTIFRVFAPEAQGVDTILYDEPRGEAGRESLPMRQVQGGVWEVTVPGDLHERCYAFKVHSADTQTGREVGDPYSRCNTGHDGRARVVDVRRLDPPAFRPIHRPATIKRPTDAVVWEVHTRDFTISPTSGVPQPIRGKYLGATVRGTKVPGTDIATCIDHLVELGVTHVQILPLQDFDNVENGGDYNWGYMPCNYFSPDGWFASNHRDVSRIAEAKAMIQAFHDAGLRVILDVVYNHTAPIAPFEHIAPRYYHRRRDDGTFWNGSGCGNEFRTEAPMVRKLILDSCRYWVEEFGVDGFRFDLMGLVDLGTMKAIREELQALDPTLLLYGEPWAAAGPDKCGISRITSKFMVAGTGIGAFNDHFRNDLKGDPDGRERGYVQDGSRRDGVRRGLQGAIYDWAWHPFDTIQYATCHDNLTLWDKLALSMPEATEVDRLRMQALAIAILSVSQGVMFLHGGIEMARSKGGDHNSYNAPDSTNQIDWQRKQLYLPLVEYARSMIALRRRHPVFRLALREEVESRLHLLEGSCPSDKCIAFTLHGGGLEGETWSDALILINPESHSLGFTLPKGHWFVQALDHEVVVDGFGREVSGTLDVPARSLAVLAR